MIVHTATGRSSSATGGIAPWWLRRFAVPSVRAASGGTAIGPIQLSDRLTELQELGILRPRACAGTRQEYRLTQAGIALLPMTLVLVRWGNRWLEVGDDPLTVRHMPCGEVLDARWHCCHSGGTLRRETVRFA